MIQMPLKAFVSVLLDLGKCMILDVTMLKMKTPRLYFQALLVKNLKVDRNLQKLPFTRNSWVSKKISHFLMMEVTVALQLIKRNAYRNDYDIPVEIFNTVTDEVIEYNSEAYQYIIGLLKNKTKPSPFAINSNISQNIETSSGLPSDVSYRVPKAAEKLIKHIEEGRAEIAIDELNRLKKGLIKSLPLKTWTDLIDICLQKDLTKRLSSSAQVMSCVIENAKTVLKPILEKYSAAGDVEKLTIIANFIPDFALKNVGFNTHFAKAFIVSGKPADLLSYLEERCDKNKLFFVPAFEELLNFPEYENRILKLATKYLEMNFDLPLGIMWTYFFTKERYEKADEIFKMFPKHSFPADKIDRKVLRVIKENENVLMGQKFLNLIRDVDVRDRVKERIYGTVLDVLVTKEKYVDALALVLEAEKQQLLLHEHYRSTLLTLKEAMEQKNMPVPFNIPAKDFDPDTNANSHWKCS